MPELIEDSELYLTRRGGSGEIQIDTGDPIDVQAALQAFVDGNKRFQEQHKGLVDKNAREAEEQRRRTGQPPVANAPLPPAKAVATPDPVETNPINGESPSLNGTPDLAATPSDSGVLNTAPQSSHPLVNAREPSHTAYDQLNPIAPEDINDLLAAPPADFDAFINRLKRNQPEPGERDPTFAVVLPDKPVKAGDPVDLSQGAFTLSAVDLNVPTPFSPIAMSRSYRSGRPYFGPFGYGWDHPYNVYLRKLNDGGLALWTGQLHEEYFRNTGAGFEPQPSFAARLEQQVGLSEVFFVEFPGGTRWIFERPTGWSNAEQIPLVTIEDRYGNAISLTYGSIDRLISVLDGAGRGLLLFYGSCDLLERVTDHTGAREVRYEHDPEIEHLIRVLLPATLQYPKGLQTSYEYASFAPHPAMRHNILRIFDADNRLVVENDFAGPDAGWEFNSIVRQRMAGFEYQFEYEQIQYVAPDPLFVNVLATRTLVRSPDGGIHTYTFNYRGDLLDYRCRLIRDRSFRVIASQWEHDAAGNLTLTIGPDGLRSAFFYDSANANPCARHNLLRVELAAPMSGIFPSRVLFQAKYEPRFQLPTLTTDEIGAETRFSYDFDVNPTGTGRLTRIQLPAVVGADGVPQQSNLVFEHNNQGQLTATVKAEGGRTELTYKSGGIHDGFLSEVTSDPSGAALVTKFLYDVAGFPKQIQAPGGVITGLEHNANGQVEEIVRPEVDGLTAKVRRWFDDSGALVRMERPAGSFSSSTFTGTSIVDEYQRNEVGHVRAVTLAANTGGARHLLQQVDHEGHTVSSWDAAGIRSDRLYGENGALVSETSAAGESIAQTTQYSRDRVGRVTRIVGAAQDQTAFEYDVWGRLHRITLPGGAVKTLEFGANDRLLEERVEDLSAGPSAARLLRRQTYDYDARGRLIARTQFSFRDNPVTAVPLKTRHLYDRDDNLREIQLPRGARYQSDFDKIGRPTSMIDLHGNEHHFVYDASGSLSELKMIEVENGAARLVTRRFFYDARGRPKRTEYLGTVAQIQYDDRDLPIEQLAPTGVTNRQQFDALGQLVENLTDPGGLALRSLFEYDTNGRLRRYVDPTGEATTWDRDALGRTVAFRPPDGTTWETSYDTNAGTLEERTPSGNTIVFEHEPAQSQPVRMICLAAAGHDAVAVHHFSYDGMGQLVSASVGADSLLRKYDSLGRLVEETARGQNVRLEYDDTLGATDLVFPDGRRERTEHNPAGQCTRIVLITPGVLGGMPGDVLLEIDYSTAGRPSRLIYGNGVEGELVHDDQGRIIRVEYQKSGVSLDSCRLRYDEGGHRALVQYLGSPTRNLLHRFDGSGRLVEARSGFPLAPLADVVVPAAQVAEVAAARITTTSAPGVAFALDDADTRTSLASLNGGPPSESYVSGKDHRVTSVGGNTISYNQDGHRIGDAQYKYTLDALNRITSVRESATNMIVAELQYDALSRVAAGTTDSQGFERWFAGSMRIHEVSGPAPGAARQYSSHPLWPAPFCVVEAAGPNYFHQDEGWSTMCVTDAAGAVLERHRYDTFGAATAFAADGVTPLGSLKTEPVWRGMPALGTTPLFSTPRRVYDPKVGVFMSRDSLLYLDSPSPYAYTAHNPVDFADPSGLAKEAISELPAGQYVKETVIHAEEVHFFAGQSTPPPEPDHQHGFYPLKDADRRLTLEYGSNWETLKSALSHVGQLKDLATALDIVEDLDPYNIPDHFLAAGAYAKRWVWFSQRGQTGRGLVELLRGHLEASSAVGSAETGGALLKSGVAMGAAAIAKRTTVAEAPQAYSVALQINLNLGEVPAYVSDAGRRARHRDIGQVAVFDLVNGWRTSLNPEERALGARMQKLLKNSNDWQLHHNSHNEGILELVFTNQHQDAAFADLFHPVVGKVSNRTTGRVGGFYIWGLAY
ncbi:MAG: hypothetical protein HIU93_10615 [Acidobacteria bacterium]|nr:hypothetical protein [Acidobacteriota bacterium]